ncbi:ankyrin-2-like [Branchiostoma floridae]|uniref:Ankyrin-2-like n=1 Tax=Branchiostoma floridae TaxID=7739 RepID=A0A9J7M4D6_BRAFL|nr:ankyrin-2-like [Branchiostoma floridae]
MQWHLCFSLLQDGKTSLHIAAEKGHIGVAELLLKAGAYVSSMDWFEATPLRKAASGGHLGVSELLLKAGARVDSWIKHELLHAAAEKGNAVVVELLLKTGTVFELLLKTGTQVDSRNKREATPLHEAAYGGHVDVVELLLKAGARVDITDRRKATPLHEATSGGHVDVVELLLKAGARVDITDKNGRTPKDIAAECIDVSFWDLPVRIQEGRKSILKLFATVMAAGPYRRIVRNLGPEGGELRTASCTITVPHRAVTMETEITCQVINPNDVSLPLKDGEMLVSDVIELGPPGTTFHQPVTAQMTYNNTSLGGAREAVVWVTGDRSQWTDLKTTKVSEDKVAVSVDHSTTFVVVSQLKQDKVTVSTEECTLTSSTQPAVQISFPEEAVTTPTQINIQVQEVPERAVEGLKAEDESSRGLVSTSPIVKVETDSGSAVQFQKPATVRVPHPNRNMDIGHEGDTKLKVMSYEKGTEDWLDETDNSNPRESDEFVEFEVSHCTSWIVIIVKDIYQGPEELGPIPLKLCRWLQNRSVQFILLQRKNNMKQVVIECTLTDIASEKRASLMEEGYEAPLPSGTVNLFEGQRVEIKLVGNVEVAFGLGSNETKHQLTFHSQQSNRLHMQVMASNGQPGLDGEGIAAFFSLPRVEVTKQQGMAARARKALEKVKEKPPKGFEQPKFLCQLPIHVPYEPLKQTEDESATLEGVAKCFYFIKENVSTDWMDLAFHLGFNGADIANITGRNRDDKSRCMDMLWEWKKRKGGAATTEVLLKALSKAALQSVLDGLRNKFPDIGKFNEGSQ